MWDGRAFWYNIDTKVSVWQTPEDVTRAQQLADGEEMVPPAHAGPKPFMMRRAEYGDKLLTVMVAEDGSVRDFAEADALVGSEIVDERARRQVYVGYVAGGAWFSEELCHNIG